MGVDYYIVCDEHKEKVWLWSLPYIGEKTIDRFLRGSLDRTSLDNVPKWTKPFLDERFIGKIDLTIKFRERHCGCKLILRHDHLDDDADEYPYFAELDCEVPVDRTEDFLENIRTKSPMFVRGLVSMGHKAYKKIVGKVLEECPEAKYVLRNSPPFDYHDREDVRVAIPVREYLGGYRDADMEDAAAIMSPYPNEEFRRDVWRTCDGRLFYTVQNTLMDWISEEEFEKMKEECKEIEA